MNRADLAKARDTALREERMDDYAEIIKQIDAIDKETYTELLERLDLEARSDGHIWRKGSMVDGRE